MGLAHDGVSAGLGDQWLIGFQPGPASTGYVHGRVAVHFHVLGRAGGASSGAADDEIVGVRIEFVDAQRELIKRDIDGLGNMSGVEFIRVADVEDVGVVGYFVYGAGFKVVHVAYGKSPKRPTTSKTGRFTPDGVYSESMTEHDAIASLTAAQVRDAIAAGTYTARQVTEYYLAQISRRTDLGAFMAVHADAALERADELDAAYQSTGVVGPLHGLPSAFKDTVNVTGMVTTFGSELFADSAPQTEDDPVSLNFNTAGAVQVGKTTIPEFALPCHSDSLISDPARNPLNTELTAGGSSGGAAAAVAAGLLPVAPGTDGGGSIRIPAAATGLVGVKPGRGTIPTDEQRDDVTNLTVTGPLARTVEDAGMLLDALVDPTQQNGRYQAAAQNGRESAGELNIGYTTASPFQPDLNITLSQAAVQALTLAVTLLSRDGLAIEEMDFSYLPDYHRNFQTVWTNGLASMPLPEGGEERLGALARSFLEQARERTQEQYVDAVTALTDWATDTRRKFADYDVVLTPVLAFTPPPVGTFTALPPQEDYEYQCKFTPYTSMINVLGLPAISVPVKNDDNGMSWSIQAVGRVGTEDKLLRLGARLEALVAAPKPTE